MDDIHKLSLIALSAVDGVGNQTLHKLNDAHNNDELDWDKFWVSKPDILKKYQLNEKQIHSINRFKKEYTIYSYPIFLQNHKIRAITYLDVEYPPLLKTCRDMPLVLFAKGKPITWIKQPVVAVVGTRHITEYGKQATGKITTELLSHEALIVSGFMYGVDCYAHQICLEQHGTTIGVLGYGFEYCYPQALSSLMNCWIDQGMTFLSPFAPHVKPTKGTFPARNRVVAGMSHAVVVTEAGANSGSHITAGYAADEGRIVGAVPGPITSPYSAGTTALINQGALLVDSGAAIITEIRSSFGLLPEMSELEQQLFTLVGKQDITIHQAAEYLDLPFQRVQSLITQLEINQLLTQEGNILKLPRGSNQKHLKSKLVE